MAEENKKPVINADPSIVQKLEKELLVLIEQSKPLSSELQQTYLTQYGVSREEAKSLFRYLVKKDEGIVASIAGTVSMSEEDASTPASSASTPGVGVILAPPRMTAQVTGDMTNEPRQRAGSDSSDGLQEFFCHDSVKENLAKGFNEELQNEEAVSSPPS